MIGRVKRRRGLAAAEALAAAQARTSAARALCALCARPLGRRVERHHRIPRSEGGTELVALHPICHRAIHAAASNRELATGFADLDALRARDDIARFLRWVADKPPDFHAPTHAGRPT